MSQSFIGHTRQIISANTQGLQQDKSHLGGKMTKSAIAVPSLALGQVSTVKILEMCFHETFTGFLFFFQKWNYLGSLWSKLTLFTTQKLARLYWGDHQSRKCTKKKKKIIEFTKFVLYQPCTEHSSHARQQRQKASGLVLLGKDAPDHLVALYQLIKEIMTRPLCQWIQSLWYVFTWYLEMIVKSAALSSNQAVGVKKSLRFGVQVLQTLNRALYEDFILYLSSFFLMFVWRPWIGKSVCSNWSQVGKDKMVVVHLWWNFFYVSLGGKFSNPHILIFHLENVPSCWSFHSHAEPDALLDHANLVWLNLECEM